MYEKKCIVNTIKIYYENLRYMDYFGEIKDVEVYMDDVNSKETLKK